MSAFKVGDKVRIKDFSDDDLLDTPPLGATGVIVEIDEELDAIYPITIEVDAWSDEFGDNTYPFNEDELELTTAVL